MREIGKMELGEMEMDIYGRKYYRLKWKCERREWEVKWHETHELTSALTIIMLNFISGMHGWQYQLNIL